VGGVEDMDQQEAIGKALALVSRSEIAMLGTNGDDGYPNIKAMINMEHQGLKEVWFSTNTSSRRVGQLLRDPRACVYYVDFERWMGLMLVGTVEVLQDVESKERLWRAGFEKYYPLGVTDPDYSVLHFTAEWGNFYHALSNVTFEV
jgi:general stress protein 26